VLAGCRFHVNIPATSFCIPFNQILDTLQSLGNLILNFWHLQLLSTRPQWVCQHANPHRRLLGKTRSLSGVLESDEVEETTMFWIEFLLSLFLAIVALLRALCLL
jgi:hypothetical protein